jgi:hypothetical protein
MYFAINLKIRTLGRNSRYKQCYDFVSCRIVTVVHILKRRLKPFIRYFLSNNVPSWQIFLPHYSEGPSKIGATGDPTNLAERAIKGQSEKFVSSHILFNA